MAYYTEYGQRKSLGMRYQQDPAYLLDKQRLEQEYALMPQRAALAENKRQADIQRQAQEDAAKRSGMSGLIGTAGNLAGTYMVSKAMAPAAANATGMGIAPIAGGGSTIAPTTTGAGASVLPLSETGTMGATAAGSTPIATGGLGLSTLPASAYVAPVGAGVIGGMLGKSGTGQDIGKILMFGQGGNKENAAVSGSVAGSALGAVAGGIAAGASLTSWSGPGAIVGAVIGGIVGGVSALVDSHICTATHKIVGMSEEEIEKMKSLKEYALEKHFGWINSYMNNAPELILEITAQENNLVDFYKGIRTILIEPIFKETDIEKCFQIYLTVTKLLFKAYMPDFNFQEEN